MTTENTAEAPQQQGIPIQPEDAILIIPGDGNIAFKYPENNPAAHAALAIILNILGVKAEPQVEAPAEEAQIVTE